MSRSLGYCSAPDLCRKSDATFYTWRKKYGGMEASEAADGSQKENTRLKKLRPESIMDASTGKSSGAWVKEERHDLGD